MLNCSDDTESLDDKLFKSILCKCQINIKRMFHEKEMLLKMVMGRILEL